MFGWDTLIDLAQELARHEDEASKRAAISRAYYGALHLARQHIERTRPEVELRPSNIHQEVWLVLADPGATRQERTATTCGQRLRRARVAADYEDSVTRLDEVVLDALRNALRVRNSLG